MIATDLPPLSDQVVDWLLLLRSGQATRHDYANFVAWRKASPLHENAWQQATHAFDRPDVNRINDAHPADDAPQAANPCRTENEPIADANASTNDTKHASRRRRFLGGTLFLLTTAGAASAVRMRDFYPLNALSADAATNTGERRHYQLSDGTNLLLDARSRINLDYTSRHRRLILLDGAASITPSHDPQRPFLVQTSEGTVRTNGGRVMVRQQEGRTLVVAHEGEVIAETIGGARRTILGGLGVRFNTTRLDVARKDLVIEAAWEGGWINANNRPLAAIIAALRPYHPGLLRVSAAAGGLPVTGMYPLDNPHTALTALQTHLPILVKRVTPWLVSIDVRLA